MVEKMVTKYQAARQVARLYSGRMTAEQARDIASKQSVSAEFRQDFVDIAEGLADMEMLAGDPDILSIVETASLPRRQRNIRWLPSLAAAASLLLVAGLIWQWQGLLGDAVSESTGQRYVTRVGEQKTIELDDGSVVTLNTGTELQVMMGEHKRQLHLKRGEAYFAVTKDASRPFTIDLGERSVTVLGTEFNIRKTPEKLTIGVLDGEISLHKNDVAVVPTALLISAAGNANQKEPLQQVRIKAGWAAEVNLEDNAVIGYVPENIDRLQSWRSGQLRFDEEPLSAVIRELNRYVGKKILIEDAAIMDMKIYAAVRIDRIDLALASLEKTLPIKVVHYFDRTILVGKSTK